MCIFSSARVVQILALKSPGAGQEMDTIASGTGGVVETTASDSSDIVEKILAASPSKPNVSGAWAEETQKSINPKLKFRPSHCLCADNGCVILHRS